jgi:molecular chaperone GrpE
MSDEKSQENTNLNPESPETELNAEDITISEGDGNSADSELGSEQSIEDQLAAAQSKVEENWSAFLAAKAETDNIRKRSEKEVSNARLFALEKFAAELLPIKDSLEMGLKAAEEAAEVEQVKEGTELTLKMLHKAFEKFGIIEVESAGMKLNPEHHEAVTMVPHPEVEPNTIVDVIQKGYTLNKRLIRPAMVVVSKGQ